MIFYLFYYIFVLNLNNKINFIDATLVQGKLGFTIRYVKFLYSIN